MLCERATNEPNLIKICLKIFQEKKLTQMQEYLLLLLENEMKRKKDPTQFFVEQSKVKKSYEIFEILLLFWELFV